MVHVHSTATVDPEANIEDEAEIGPRCDIRGKVRIAAGTRLIGQVSLRGPLSIGRGNTIYPQVCIGFAPQSQQFDPTTDGAGTVLGNDNIIRECVTIHRATGDRPTTVGDRNYLMVNSHLGHDVIMGSDISLANGATIGGHCVLSNQVLVSGYGIMHQFCRVGRLGMVGGLVGLAQDLPPFCTAYVTRRVGSLNLIGLRRAGYRDHIPTLKQAFEILYGQKHSNKTAVELIEKKVGHDPLCMELAQFVRTTIRGITPYAPSGSPTDDQGV